MAYTGVLHRIMMEVADLLDIDNVDIPSPEVREFFPSIIILI
jgi:hypothetical protein